MERMKHVLLRKFMASVLWRRLYSYQMLLYWLHKTSIETQWYCVVHKSTHVSSRCRRQSIVCDNITKTVSEVKQRYSVRETTAINGPEGTVSNKTQVLLEEGMRRLHNIASIDNGFLEDIDLHISYKSCGESKRSQVFYS